MEEIEIIHKYQNLIEVIYKREGILSLSSNNYHSSSPNENLLQRYLDIIGFYAQPGEDFLTLHKIFDDLVFLSKELMFHTANLYLHRPYINNPLDTGINFNGETIYSNYQNLSSLRYSMFTNAAYQTTYNYWDKIGDMLAHCFETKLKPRQIDFSKVIEALETEFTNNSNYNWIKKFKETEYSILNKSRLNIVHYLTPETTAKYEHIFNPNDPAFLESWQKRKTEIANYFNDHTKLMLDGFSNILILLEKEKP
ncbi:MAG: Cthe_2314 family HEPN domain-containing protein [Bacteroidota bacterium]